jgi:hypothetical protein
VSKSARKRFVIKIKKQPAPVALKGRARQHDARQRRCLKNRCISKMLAIGRGSGYVFVI